MTKKMSWRLAPAVVLVSGLALLATACTSATAAQTSPVETPTATSQTAAAPAATAPTAAADPSSASATAQLAAGAIRFTLVPDGTQASYHAREQLVGRSLPNEAVGTTSAVSGSIVLAPDGSVIGDQSMITVDLRTLQSDESRRDGFIQRNTLQTSQFPTATFVPHTIQGLPWPLPTSGTATFQLSGDLTVHGVTRPATWQVAAQFNGQDVTGSATTTVQFADFGMTPPKAGPVLSVEDSLGLRLDFHATSAAA